jgi:hypothetical protein
MWYTYEQIVIKQADKRRADICALAAFYAAQNACYTLKDGIDSLSRNVAMELRFYAAQNPRIVQLSFTSRRKPDITHNDTQLMNFIETRRSSVIFSDTPVDRSIMHFIQSNVNRKIN